MGLLTIQDRRLAGVTLVPDDFVDYYMTRANGEFVKIYLYLLRCVHKGGSDPSLSSLADVFSCTEKDIIRALRYWERAGLVTLTFHGKDRELERIELLPINASLQATQQDPEEEAEETKPEPVAKEEPERQISVSRVKELKNDAEAKQVLFFTEQYLGHTLSPTDMRRILYFYDELHFPVDLIDYLVEYCVSRGGRSLNYIEKVGISWKEEGITSVKDAKETSSVYRNKYFAIFRAFGIRNRNPIPDEKATMDRWLNEYGFSIDIIKEAASRTVKNTGTQSFKYAERILSDWHQAGVTCPEDIARIDEQHEQARLNGKRPAASSSARSSKAPVNSSTGFNGNFEQRDYDFDDLEARLLASQNPKKPK